MRLNISLGLLTATQLVANFAVQLVLLRLLGAGTVTDSYVAAQSIPLLLYAVLGLSLQNVWLPLLSTTEDVRSGISVGLGQALLTSMASAVIIGVSAYWWVQLIFPGFAVIQLDQTVSLIRIMLIGGMINCAAALLTAGGRVLGRFLLVEAIPTVTSLVGVAALFIVVPRFGVIGAAWLFVGRSALSFLLIWLSLGTPLPDFRRNATKQEAARHLRPLLGGSSFYKLAPLVDRFWSSQSMAGGMTLYNLAQGAMGAGALILDRAIGTPVVPSLARHWKVGNKVAFRRAYRQAVLQILGMVAAGLTLLLVFSSQWAMLLEWQLRLSPAQVGLVLQLLLAFIGYVAVAAAGNIVVASFYATGDTRTPVIIGMCGFIAGTALKSIAFVHFGLIGMAVATSLYYTANLVITIAVLEKRIHASCSSRHKP